MYVRQRLSAVSGLRALLLLAGLLIGSSALATIEWPQEITADGGTIVIYQPQPETLEGNTLTGRAAMALQEKGGEPIFGAFWFEAKIDTDRDQGLSLIHISEPTRRATISRMPSSA